MRPPRRSRLGRSDVALVAVLAVVLGAAPTVGDIGSCGTQATALDVTAFAASLKALDCDKCEKCGLSSETCKHDCDPSFPSTFALPSTCFPLAHDGQVCLDALQAASCSDYAGYVSDTAPTQPPECQFCLDVPDGGA